MVETIKFSEFTDGGDLSPDQTTVGLDNTLTINTRFNNPFPLLAPGTTGDRPAIAPSMYYRLRFNTTTLAYEYYEPLSATWIELEDSASVLPLLASHAAGEGASLIGLQNQGGVLNKTVQDLANSHILSTIDDGTLVNGIFLSTYPTGFMSSTTVTGALNTRVFTGTANQIDIANGDGSANPLFTLSSTLDLPGTFTIQGSTVIDEIINDDTMATALATNIPTALSVKNYVDSSVGGAVTSATGTANQVLVNATSGTPQTGALTFTLPQDIGTGSSPTFSGIGLTTGSVSTLPVNSTDIANKAYVDSIATGITVQGACYAGTTANLAGYTYSNGASGVGATLTAGSNGAFSTDGVSPALNARILVKNQSTTAQNGIYTLTTVGDGSTPAVLTRATDYDQVSEINPGDLVVVTNGTTLASSSWLETATVATIGTDPIVFAQFTASLPITVPNGGTGLTTFNAYRIIAGGTTSTGALQQIAAGTTGTLLQSQGAGALAAYTTATYPSTVTANNILYASGTNAVGQLTPGTGVLTALGQNVTGSGGIVLSTSPVITTPWITTAINDSNGNAILNLNGNPGTIVNSWGISNATTGNNPTLLASGTDSNVAAVIQGKGTAGVWVQGRSTNSNASAGYIGEYISSNVAVGSKISLTTATPANVTSISLTAGDWDISWCLLFETANTTSVTVIRGGLNTATATVAASTENASQFLMQWAAFVPGITTFMQNGARSRQSLSGTTTIYLNAQSTFTVNSMFVYGWLSARRI